MKKTLLSILSGFLVTVGFAQLNGTYTINSASATGGTNYQTFAAACSALTSQGVNGPVTFNVLTGNYSNDQINFGYGATISGTSTTNTVTFQSDASNTSNPEITRASQTLYMYYSNLNNITFKEIDITATSSYPCYIYYGTANNIHFEDCNITNPTGTSGYPLYLYRTTANDFVMDGCNLSGGYYGAYVYYLGSNSSVDIINGSITEFYYMGIYAYYGYYPYVLWNVDNNYIANDAGANSYSYAFYSYYSRAGSNFSNNKIELDGTNGGYGCMLYYPQGTSSSPVKFTNNMINYPNSSNAGSQYGIRAYYTKYTNIDHNTVKTSGSGNNYGAYLYYYSGSYSGNTFRNNIIANPGGSGYNIYYYSYYNAMATTFSDYDYNAYQYGNSSTEVYNYDSYSGTTGTNLSGWNSGTSVDDNSIVADPLFMSNYDLHSGSIGINEMGTYVGITTDIDGETRSTTTPDIGADEFIVPTNNAQPGDLLTPDAPLCADDTSISIMLNNMGLVALTSCSLNYSINGGTTVSSQWTGNLAIQSDTLAIVESSITFTSGDELKIWTSMPNGVVDSSANNDTVGVTLYDGLTGTFAIPADYATLNEARDDLVLKGVCGHVVFNIATGTYTENVSFPQIQGTGEDATITFQSASGNTNDVLIEYDAASTGDNYVVQFAGVDWITFQDLRMKSLDQYSYAVVLAVEGGSNNNTIDNCWLKGNAYNTTSNYAANIRWNGSSDGFTLTNSHIEAGSSNMYMLGYNTANPSEDITMENNLFEDGKYYQMMLYAIDGFVFDGNTVTNDSALYSGTYGYYQLYMYYVNNFDITRNYVNHTVGQGYYYPIYFNNCVGRNNPRSQVANNCFFGGMPGATGYNNYAVYSYNSGVMDFHNNSVTKRGGSTNSTMYISNGGLISLKNNSFANMTTGYALQVYGGFAVSESENNNLYTEGNSLVYFGTSAYATLEAYQTGTGNDMNSVVTNPNWETDVTCVTCNDTLDNAGQVLANNTIDIDNNVRSVATPDIGAVEFVDPGSFTLGGDDTVCGSVVIVEAGPAQSVTWNVNNQTSTQSSVTLTATTEPVTYNISVSITTEYCGSGSDNAIYRVVPDATLDSAAHICADETLDLEPGGGSGAVYAWSNGETTSSITATEAGTYSVNKMEDGCESDATIVVTQSEGVEIVDLDACSDDLPISIDATIANGTSYAWSGGTSINTASNDFTDAGTYSVTATDAFGCSSTDDFGLTVLEAPTAAITETHAGNAYFFDGTSSLYISNNTTYNWDFGYNNLTATTPTATVTYPWSDPNNPTTYTVTLSIDNGCGTDVKQTDYTPDPLGIDAIAEGSFGLYPNPANENVNFVLDGAASAQGTVQVMDIAGRVLASQIIAAGQINGEINLTELASGSYLVKISVDGNSSVNTLIKQ
ncbi:T9SS type A sorting domain-containing protein [Salibacteraceae bacterium]|nr:T9SS type A sorting domain-containing protein [Salibacteraceae bacterium]